MNLHLRVCSALLLATACSDPGPSGPSRTAVVADLVQDVAVPRHLALVESTTALATALDVCAAPTADAIAAAQTAWRRSARDWAALEPFGYGPAMEQHIDADLWFWPTRTDAIDELVASDVVLDAALVDGLGAASKGLPAIEAQLFDATGGDVAARFDPADPAGARRCTLVHELAVDAAEQADTLATAWQESFAGTLSTPGGDNELYPDESAALGELANGVFAMLQVIDDAKLSKPFGAKAGGTPQPELVEAPHADASLDQIAANLATVRALYVGEGDGLGLDDLVLARAPMLDATIVDGLDDADAKIAAIPPPLRTAISGARPGVQAGIDAIKVLRRAFTTDLAQQLGITVTLSDNDGD